MVWTFTSKDYVKSIINNLESRLAKRGQRLPSKGMTPMSQDYKPELDKSDELEKEDITMFQEL